jgi:hypothetical protein
VVPILSQISPVYTPLPPFCQSKIHCSIVHPPTSWSAQWALSFWPSHQYSISRTIDHWRSWCRGRILWPTTYTYNILYIFLFSPFRATCPAHLILLYMIILIILDEEYKLRSSLCSFLQPLVTSSFFGPNILLNTLFSNTPSLCFSLNVRDILQVWRVAANILNKQSRTADKGWSSILGLGFGLGLTSPRRKISACYERSQEASDLDGFLGYIWNIGRKV